MDPDDDGAVERNTARETETETCIVLDLIEPVETDDGNLKAEAASPVNAPAEKRSKLGCHPELLRLETERCMNVL
ncbi:unnamed protein product [Arctogadus glacialis]